MNYVHQHIRSAELICGLYDGSQPLAVFLKQYFAQHKKFGSKDRKRISHLCYTYYRIGHALPGLPFTERIKAALFLCHQEPAEWKDLYEPGWINEWRPLLQDRIKFIKQQFPSFTAEAVFPWQHRLSKGKYDADAFSFSHLVQPNLFLRLRPGYTETVRHQLQTAGVFFASISETCLALPNGTKMDDMIMLDREAVVQDHSSQQVGELLKMIPGNSNLQVWDCCAASGGKSILAQDMLPSVKLTVSDIRESIIQNLRKRFDRAGIHAKKIFVADISQPIPAGSLPDFDLVICDVPCTGSGTWGRTPEHLYFFQEEKIQVYAALQRKIVAHVLPHIKNGGYLLYSTCSVFSEENEAVLSALPPGMETVGMEWLKGYDHKADSMFAALLRKT